MMRARTCSVVMFCSLAFVAACGSKAGQLFDSTGGSAGLGGAGGNAASGGAGGSTEAGASSGGIAGAVTAGGSSGSPAGGALGGGGEGGAGPSGTVLQSGSIAIPAFSMPNCQHVTFPSAFDASAAELRVLVTLVHPGSTNTHNASAVWAQAVSATGFDACITEDAGFDNEHPRSRIDWVAMVESAGPQLGLISRRQALSGAGEAQCQLLSVTGVTEPWHVQASLDVPSGGMQANRGTSLWFEQVAGSEARLCARLLENADGALAAASVDWVAYSASFARHGFTVGEHDFESFNGTHCDTIATGCAGCQNAQIRVNHRRRTESATFTHGATLAWVEDFDAAGQLTVCARETSAENNTHDAHMSVDWFVRQTND
ncbi:MAG: hypothetical protein QM756_22725 [Polyangiaceae bacterium]